MLVTKLHVQTMKYQVKYFWKITPAEYNTTLTLFVNAFAKTKSKKTSQISVQPVIKIGDDVDEEVDD